MSMRILALARYLFTSILFSLTGLLYFLLALAFFIVFLDPRQRTPDVDYYILSIGIFGSIIAFLSSLSIAGRANQATNFPLIVRLPSRIEYLASVVTAAFGFSLLVQVTVALLTIFGNGPDLSLRELLELPPIWLAADLLFIVMGLHAADLVASGWSRVYVYGVLAILLYFQSGSETIGGWLVSFFNLLSEAFLARGFASVGTGFTRLSSWLQAGGLDSLHEFLGFVFWPFDSLASAVIGGRFSPASAMAPAVLLLYATILFIMASKFFAEKDLLLSE